MKNKIFSMFDYVLILLAYAVIITGIFFIYSSGFNDKTPNGNLQFLKQIIWSIIGLVFMIFFTLYDYRKLENISMWLFLGAMFLLLLVLIPHIGKDSHNARSWLGIGVVGFQPAEVSKIFYILFLAKVLNDSQNEAPMLRFVKAIGIMAAPFLLILIQPDLGTASVYIPVFFMMCFFAGIPVTYLLYILAFGMLTIIFTILPEMNKVIFDNKLTLVVLLTNLQFRLILIGTSGIIALLGFILRKYFHAPRYINWVTAIFSIICFALILSLPAEKVLSSNQKKRLFIFLNPEKDRDRVGYQIIQSKITIGGGNIFGKGFMNGSQTHLEFLPEQSTDFIFSIFSEEAGFLGGITIFAIYFVILVKMLFIVRKCPNRYGLYVSSGIFAMFFFHFIVNVGMVMGVGPVTGIPLMLMSYGGSSLLTSLISLGLMQSIKARKKELV